MIELDYDDIPYIKSTDKINVNIISSISGDIICTTIIDLNDIYKFRTPLILEKLTVQNLFKCIDKSCYNNNLPFNFLSSFYINNKDIIIWNKKYVKPYIFFIENSTKILDINDNIIQYINIDIFGNFCITIQALLNISNKIYTLEDLK